MHKVFDFRCIQPGVDGLLGEKLGLVGPVTPLALYRVILALEDKLTARTMGVRKIEICLLLTIQF